MHKFKIAIIAGEESGDQLGADIIQALEQKITEKLELIGVGGENLEALGLKSLFPSQDIALMGISAVLKKLPLLIKHIKVTAKFIAKENPDCLLIIDSQEFTHRVAKKVRSLNPSIPIIQYIAPSVWAWRPERAKNMAAYIDHVLVVLPFEEKIMHILNGPPATYVGHRLVSYPSLIQVKNYRKEREISEPKKAPVLVVLPGSRNSEIEKLMPIFGEAVAILKNWMPELLILLPTLPKIQKRVREFAQRWKFMPEIYVGEEKKWQIFKKADIALAASGTVSLELALCRIPMVLCYKADLFSKLFIQPRIKIWSAALPNIITDMPIITEFFNEFVRPNMLAHQLRYLLENPTAYALQCSGFKQMEDLMHTKKTAGEIGAQKILEYLQTRNQVNSE